MKIILIVEPNLQRRATLCERYGASGHVIEAASVSNAREIVGEILFDIVVIANEPGAEEPIKEFLEVLKKKQPAALVVWQLREDK